MRFLPVAALFVLSGSSALSAQAPLKAASDSQTVVFVCEHGTVKSVVALAYFRLLARERHLPIRAISRGTAPWITPSNVSSMTATFGHDARTHRPSYVNPRSETGQK